MRNDSLEPGIEFGADTATAAAVRDKPDGAIDPAGEAGWYLERERLARGETLDDVSAQIGIHPYHLEAIEFGDMTRMPERMDALEMIAAYSHYLGFDPEPLVTHYASFLPAPPLAPEAAHPANPGPLSSAKILAFGRLPKIPKFDFRFKLSSVPGGAGGLVASLAGAVFLFAGVSYMMLPAAPDASAPAPAAVADATPPAAEDTPADMMPTASTGTDQAEISIGDEPMTDDQQQLAAAADTGQVPVGAAPPSDDMAGTNLDGLSSLIQQEVPEAQTSLDGLKSATDMALTGAGREFGASNDESRLTLKAKAPVWIRIEDSHGVVVMTQMLMKGDTYRVPNRNGLVVIAKDGGLLSYLIDGKEKGILGTPGEILVGRSLDITTFGGNG